MKKGKANSGEGFWDRVDIMEEGGFPNPSLLGYIFKKMESEMVWFL